MAKVEFSAGIDHVSGALSKPDKGSQHSCEKMLLATHRVAPTESSDCNRIYLRNKTERSTEPTQNELSARMRFSEVASMVKARKKDLNHITQDQQAFMAQKDLPDGKVTLRAYLWKVCGEEYDAQH